MIVRKGQRWPDYLLDSNDHAPLVAKFYLDDRKLVDRNFVRIECLPLGSLTSLSRNKWEIRVDEQGTLPSWFEEKQEDWFVKCCDRLIKRIIPKWIADGVGGSLDLRDTKVTSLGKLTSVGGDLDLFNTKVTSLGKLTRVGGYLCLTNTKVTSLGKLISVGGDLNLTNTKVTSLGTLISVGGFLDLTNTKVTSLGTLISVGGDLDLRSTKVTSLGKLTRVGGSLYLRDAKVTSIPTCLKHKVSR
jgi:hypothetical protein